MIEPLTVVERSRIKDRYAEISGLRPVVTDAVIQNWLLGYEALVQQLEKKIGLLFLEREDIKAQLEERLKIARDALMYYDEMTGSFVDSRATQALAAMDAVGKEGK